MGNRISARRSSLVGALVVDGCEGKRLIGWLGAFAAADHRAYPDNICRVASRLDYNIASLSNLIHSQLSVSRCQQGLCTPRVTILVV